jgi:hypothetical protein
MTESIPPAGYAVLAVVLLGVIGGVGYLAATGGLKRFEQTSFTCRDPMFGAFEMVVNARKAGQEVRLIRPDGESHPVITSASDSSFALESNGYSLTIDTKEPSVTVLYGKRLSRSSCKMTEFAM